MPPPSSYSASLRLSPESIAELTQLLSAMDGQKQEKEEQNQEKKVQKQENNRRGNVLPRSESDVGSKTSHDGGKDSGMTRKRTSSAKDNARKSDTEKSVDDTGVAEGGDDGRKKSIAAAGR